MNSLKLKLDMNSFDFPVKVEDKTVYSSFVSFIGSNNAKFCLNSEPVLSNIDTCDMFDESLTRSCL